MSQAKSFLRRIPQYTRASRHLASVIKHGTIRKWSNLAHAELERKMRRIRLKSYPYLLIIDPCNYCNLRCPLCPTGMNDLGRPQAMLSLEHFKRYFDPLAPQLFEAYMHNWGESLLNEQVFDMIDHAQSRNVGTNLSSNLVATNSREIDKLLDCGLEYLVVSLDGVTQDVYEKYRIRGRIDNVFSNMRELLRKRDARGLKTPVVEWQFIVMKQNEHQVGAAESMAKKVGVDLLRFIPVGMPFEVRDRKNLARQWFPDSGEGRESNFRSEVEQFAEQTYKQGLKPGPCFYLYRCMVINPDGGVSPCCVVYKQNRDFAQLSGSSFRVHDIWNNDRYLSGRALFSRRDAPNRVQTVCDACDIFEWHPSKKKYGTPDFGASLRDDHEMHVKSREDRRGRAARGSAP